MLILSPLSLVAFRILLLPYPRFSSLSILPRYPYILSLFAGFLVRSRSVHVYIYIDPHASNLPFPLCIRPMFPLSPLNIFPFPSRFCVMSLAVGFPRAATSSRCQILSTLHATFMSVQLRFPLSDNSRSLKQILVVFFLQFSRDL